MYRISDEQIDYILNDIRRGGIETEDLQLNLLDHICCIIERELGEGGDFEHFYRLTARRFYKNSLREIEDETTNLLTFKNYYTMKKVLITSGALSAAAFTMGSLFKIQHWPGAGVLLALGIGSFSLLFLPLLAVLKAREVNNMRDKIVVSLACVLGIMFSLATLFTIMHWPGGSMLWFGSIAISAFVLLPVYFFTGIRRPETKLNTILVSILLLGFTGLQFTMMNTRPTKSQEYVRVQAYFRNEALLKAMQPATMSKEASYINTLCEQAKTMALDNANSNPKLLREGRPSDAFVNNGAGVHVITALHDAVVNYNKQHDSNLLPVDNTVLDEEPHLIGYVYSNVSLLNSLTQLQLYLANVENSRMASLQH